ncbi:MAG: MmgE/PrpD family protein [Deltaproteobacteria bacterium]|jgi:2-methylcitrate dehydratase PrpD|nr:MmgE/PrpD family protein [Deltaproteobacteria bacterium]
MELTKEIIQKCHELYYNDLSDDVIDRTKYLLLDYIGVTARGSLSDSSIPVLRLVQDLNKTTEGAVVIGTNIKVSPPYAALANGTAAHSLELDDVVNEASLHPAVAIMPAALAAAQFAGASGREFLAAIVTGYEVAIKLGIALDPASHYARGFHPTGTCGTMGAAITAAKILGLNQSAMTNALGVAGSMAAGSMEFLSDGAFTKRLHPGWAAHSGIMAALLAKEGFTGPGSVIEGKFGFLHTYSNGSNPTKILKYWADPYEVMNTSIKPHACCRYKQGPIDGILEIMRANRLKAPDIAKVTLGILKAGFPLVAEPAELKSNPKSVVDAQFSMPFGAAVAILHGKAALSEYSMENINSAQVKAVMDRIFCIEDPEIEKEYPKKWCASVTILTKGGQEYSTRVDYPKGDPKNPFTWEELIDKFRNLVSPVFSTEKQNVIITKVKSLEKENDTRDFSMILSKG